MKAIVLALTLCVVARVDAAEPALPFAQELDQYEREHAWSSRLKLRTMDVLLAGGIVSTITGIGLMTSDRFDQGLRIGGALSASFGVINVILGGLAIPGTVNAEKRFKQAHAERLTPEGLFRARREELREQAADVTLFAINLGLDGGYLLAGLAAVLASQLGVDNPDRWMGGGLATVVQGAFLLGVDAAGMTIARRRHAALLQQLLPTVNVATTPTGTQGSVGVTGAF